MGLLGKVLAGQHDILPCESRRCGGETPQEGVWRGSRDESSAATS